MSEARRRLKHIAEAVHDSAEFMPTHKQFILDNCAAEELLG